jgi:signal transduction histidine kinase
VNIIRNNGEYSDEMIRMFGEDPQTFAATYESFLERVHPEDSQAVRNITDRAFTDGSSYEIDYRIVLPDGSEKVIHAQSEVAPNDEGRPEHASGTVQDITARKDLEAQLRQAQKMEAVGQLAGGVAHDFNNLLTVMLGNLQLLQDLLQQDESSSRLVQEALEAGSRGSQLTNRLLTFSRQQRLAPEVMDVSKLVVKIVPLLKRTLGEDIALEIRPASDLWLTEIDLGQMESSLVNLAINARDAMPGGGTLTIKTANTTLDEARAGSDTEVPPGDYVTLTVSDTGTGMSKVVLESVFEPFFTTKAFGTGSGLGLSMVYGFVKQSNGYINIESKEELGTTFELYLPRSGSPTETTGTKSSTPVAGGQETILVVEDEVAVREVTKLLLESLGYRVIEAGTGAEALARLDAHDEIDLLLTDMMMPGGMNGAELVGQARQRHPDLKVVCTSGYAATGQRKGVLQSPEYWLNKPFNREELGRAVRDALDRG